jgi:hypothetical protein
VVAAPQTRSAAGGSDARPIPWPPGPRRATGETDPRGGASANLWRRRTCHGHCLAHPGPGTPRGGNDTPKARDIGYSAASQRSCVWWRYCGRHRGRSDRRDRRWSARGDRRRHRRCCPWRYCRQEDCRGCAAWRPAPEAIHQRRRIARAPKPARLTPNALSRPPAERLTRTAAMGSCRTFGGARPSSSSIGNGLRLRTGRSALLGGWDARGASWGGWALSTLTGSPGRSRSTCRPSWPESRRSAAGRSPAAATPATTRPTAADKPSAPGDQIWVTPSVSATTTACCSSIAARYRVEARRGGRRHRQARSAMRDRFVICRNPDEAGRDAAIRGQILEQLRAAIAGSDDRSPPEREELACRRRGGRWSRLRTGGRR